MNKHLLVLLSLLVVVMTVHAKRISQEKAPSAAKNNVTQTAESSQTNISMETIGATSGSSNGFSFTSAKGSGASEPVYNATAKDLRLYAANTLTIEAENAMTKIVFNISAQGLKRLAPITADEGSIAKQASGDETVIWTGSATSVTFTVGAKADYGSDGSSKAGQLDFTSVDITTGGTTTPTSYTVTYISCGSEFATQEYIEGQALALPDPAPGANAGKAFYGWIAEEHYTGEALPTIIEAGSEVNADATYYAVYK